MTPVICGSAFDDSIQAALLRSESDDKSMRHLTQVVQGKTVCVVSCQPALLAAIASTP